MGVSESKNSPTWRRLQGPLSSNTARVWLPLGALVFVVVLALSSKHYNSGNVHGNGSGFTFRARFPGVFGMLALEKLIAWNDDLFRATMTMYKHQAEAVCSNLSKTREACVNATLVRRPPEPVGHKMYDLFQPYIKCPSGNKMMNRVGDTGDGGKWLCDELLQKDECVVFSLGSNGQYDFERALLKQTKCKIYTFDCTYEGNSLGKRHEYIKKCIGTVEKAGINKDFMTLSVAARDLGVNEITLLKIDIEGYEFDEIAGWSVTDLSLPEQISIEVHHSQVIYHGGANSSHYKVQDFSNLLWPVHHLSLSDLALFFGHFGRLGYAIVSREDNPFGNCCSEFLLLKVADWKPIS